MPEFNFDGKVAIITGAGSGLGRCYALELAKQGAKVIVNDTGSATDGTGNNRSAVNSVVEEINDKGGNSAPNFDSVSTTEGGKSIVKEAVKRYGKIDILINNAGIIRDRSFMKMSGDEWDDVHAVHLKGVFNVTNAAWPVFKKNKYGRILLISSSAGLYGNFGQANYGAAKAGMIGLMNCLNIEGANDNILVNILSPTAATRLTKKTMPAELFAKLKPEFIVPMAVYLVSEENKESGNIINAAKNWYSKTAVCLGEGVKVGDGINFPTPGEIKKNWEKITNLDNSGQIKNLSDFYTHVLGQEI